MMWCPCGFGDAPWHYPRGGVCAVGLDMPMSQQSSDQSESTETVNALTAIVREADRTFEKVGGSSRHWVRDCFLPLLNKHGWKMVQGAPRERGEWAPIETAPKDGRDILVLWKTRMLVACWIEDSIVHEHKGVWMVAGGNAIVPTYWQPLPSPPAPPPEGIESALNRLDRLAAGIVPPCPRCVSEYGHAKPDCPLCKGSGVCPSAAPPAEGRTEEVIEIDEDGIVHGSKPQGPIREK